MKGAISKYIVCTATPFWWVVDDGESYEEIRNNIHDRLYVPKCVTKGIKETDEGGTLRENDSIDDG